MTLPRLDVNHATPPSSSAAKATGTYGGGSSTSSKSVSSAAAAAAVVASQAAAACQSAVLLLADPRRADGRGTSPASAEPVDREECDGSAGGSPPGAVRFAGRAPAATLRVAIFDLWRRTPPESPELCRPSIAGPCLAGKAGRGEKEAAVPASTSSSAAAAATVLMMMMVMILVVVAAIGEGANLSW
jgi:cobalamin biosynthesis Mg chelatase CobN